MSCLKPVGQSIYRDQVTWAHVLSEVKYVSGLSDLSKAYISRGQVRDSNYNPSFQLAFNRDNFSKITEFPRSTAVKD